MMVYWLAVAFAMAALALFDLYRFDVTAVVRECTARASSSEFLKTYTVDQDTPLNIGRKLRWARPKEAASRAAFASWARRSQN